MTREETLLENLAEIALCVGRVAYSNAQPINGEGPGDCVRRRTVASAVELTRIERRRKSLWDRYDWRDTCFRIGKQIEAGEEPDVKAALEAT